MNASCCRGTITHRITFFRAEAIAKKQKLKYFSHEAHWRAHCGAAGPGGGSIGGVGRGGRSRVDHAASLLRSCGWSGRLIELDCRLRFVANKGENWVRSVLGDFLLFLLQGIQRDLTKPLFEFADLVGVGAEAVEQLLIGWRCRRRSERRRIPSGCRAGWPPPTGRCGPRRRR